MQYDLFVTRIWKSNSGNLFLNLKKDVAELMSADKGRTVSNVLGWQSRDISQKDQFKQFKKHVQTMATEPLVQFGVDTLNVKLSIEDMWANVNPNQAFNMPHDHAGNNNFLSFVYYVDVDTINGHIAFQNEKPSSKFFNLPKMQDTELNSTDVNIDVRSGDLIIFPCWLNHYTYPNRSDSNRITIAGNIRVEPL